MVTRPAIEYDSRSEMSTLVGSEGRKRATTQFLRLKSWAKEKKVLRVLISKNNNESCKLCSRGGGVIVNRWSLWYN